MNSPKPDSFTAEKSPITNLGRMIRQTLKHEWRISIAVALGVATATAVITGALLVGDSMRGSLRSLTIERLGRTESLVAPGGFFDPRRVAKEPLDPVALIFFPTGIAEAKTSDGRLRRAGSVQIIGCDDNFWDLDVVGVKPSAMPGEDSVVINQAAASELGVTKGDTITVRLPTEQAVPADSPLGRRDLSSEGLPRMVVADIIDDQGLGRFSVTASQASPQNIYLSRLLVGEVLEREGQANLLLFDRDVKMDDLTVGLEDMGLSLRAIRRTFTDPSGTDPSVTEPSVTEQTVFAYDSLTSDQLLLPEAVVREVKKTFPADQIQEVTTYLANAIEKLDASGDVIASVPYSTITGIESSETLPLDYSRPPAASSDAVPLVINDWTAKQLDVQIGDDVRVAYFEPEVENGNEIERTFDAVVTQIVPITEPAKPYRRNRDAVFDQMPTVYNDPDLTPLVPGVTDQESISDWDLPFKLDRKIAKADDEYWNNHRLTPKAFLPISDAKRLFGSRFGETTGFRFLDLSPQQSEGLGAKLKSMIDPHIGDLGWTVRPIRAQQLKASKGTTPFDGLFLALSFFVIVSAVLLIAMLFRLGLIGRTRQLGTLLATGWTSGRVRKLLLGESAIIATIGAVVGVIGGIAYAMGVLAALRSFWVGAVTVPFLKFHWTPTSLIGGGLAGWLVAMLTIVWTTRSLLKCQPQTLLRGEDVDTTSAATSASPSSGLYGKIALGLVLLGMIAAIAGAMVGGQAAAGGFVASGMILLVAALVMMYGRLKHPRRIGGQDSKPFLLGTLASRNASRRPLRSVMTIGLMASASFLIIAINAFELRPDDRGVGGFELIGQSAQPIYRDLGDPSVRSETMGPDAKELADAAVISMRLRLEQDASCNNLYQATKPTVLGVPPSLSQHIQGHGQGQEQDGDFQWASHAALESGQVPWDLLSVDAAGTQDDPIPVVIDQNTAMWSLQMLGGVGEVKSFEYEDGEPVFFRVVGLLANSVLQGKLMIGESNFQTVFPDISGYRYFLIALEANAGADDKADEVSESLESRFGDVGMDVSSSSDVLAGMLAVQNTYLRTFQSLGALGLLLGTIGLAVTQTRSVLERRKELAIMQSGGFTRKRLSAVLLTETATLLIAGIGCGTICAVLAVLPHARLAGIRPPLLQPVLIVICILAFGMLAGLVAIRRVSAMSLLDSLRSE